MPERVVVVDDDEVEKYEERPKTPGERLREAEDKVKFYRNVAIGLSFLPIPVADAVAVTGVQMAMLHSLCKTYSVRFDATRGKRVIGSLLGGFAAPTVGMAAASMFKAIPIIGLPAALLATPAAAAASTYAIGYVFIQEFESGGNMLTLDPKKRAIYYAKMYREGQRLSRQPKRDRDDPEAYYDDPRMERQAKRDRDEAEPPYEESPAIPPPPPPAAGRQTT